MGAHPAFQSSFDDLGLPLHDVNFVVVDLETTGGSPAQSRITEIGAVRTCGGVVLGEFSTLVNPQVAIPPFIAALTGITTAAVASAPLLTTALPSWLEFADGSVLVAHNARFDTGFLKVGCAAIGARWPDFKVVDTMTLSRALLSRDDVRDHRLSTLAAYFRAGTDPNHRALADARATVDVLHGLLERAGSLGAHHLDDLLQLCSPVTKAQVRKRTLADGLPELPGVYIFEDRRGNALYVGKSKCIRKRVRTYFTASERRKRMAEMIQVAAKVTAIPCATSLEAEVREVRLIAERRPVYNRRSRNPERAVWLKLTDEPFPRVSIVSKVPSVADPQSACAGPFSSRRSAQAASEALLEAVPLRSCLTRLSRARRAQPCVAAQLEQCLAPCSDPAADAPYAEITQSARSALLSDSEPLATTIRDRMRQLAQLEEFEEAAAWRERLRALLTGIDRRQRESMITACPEVVAARLDGSEWEVHVIRHGRLAGASRVQAGADPRAVVEATVATAQYVAAPGIGSAPHLPEESALVLRWLSSEGVRLVRLDGVLALPVGGAGRDLAKLGRPQLIEYPDSEPPRGAASPVPQALVSRLRPV